ncbi:MAG: pyridoxamine 5'-phosphate oxidase [Actinomycetota bacterium]|nr:pyridoxamine 5'-phosphate oxidase [Actinomycetota bacterium]
MDVDPIRQFSRWYAEAQAASQPEPEAMSLATATAGGVPSQRWVLLKGVDERGFVFYTNERSRKGVEMAANPVAALGFRWGLLDRQVRITGSISRVGDEEADRYWTTRARGSQLGAWASEQSTVIASREVLEDCLAEVEVRFRGVDVPRPPWWGGYVVAPATVELWQDRRDRLHDRLLYRREADGWVIERVSP